MASILVTGGTGTLGRLVVPLLREAVRSGANLAPDRAAGGRTWEEFLADRVAASAR
jgi:uncharacterized protein YbjT (DUF2867 family)